MTRKLSRLAIVAISSLLLTSCQGFFGKIFNWFTNEKEVSVTSSDLPTLNDQHTWGVPHKVSYADEVDIVGGENGNSQNRYNDTYTLYNGGFTISRGHVTLSGITQEKINVYNVDGETNKYNSEVSENWEVISDASKTIYNDLVAEHFNPRIETAEEEFIRIYLLIALLGTESAMDDLKATYMQTYPGARVDIGMTKTGDVYHLKQYVENYSDELYIGIKNDYRIRITDGRPNRIEELTERIERGYKKETRTSLIFEYKTVYPDYAGPLKPAA